MKLNFDHNHQTFSVELTPTGKSYRVRVGHETADVEVIETKEGKLDLLIDGRRVTACVSSQNASLWVTVDGQTYVFTKSSTAGRRAHGHHHAAGEMTAPMPGQVRAIHVGEGESVSKGQTLMLLEAMKMEIRIQSPQQGVVKRIFVSQGQTVEREQLLIEVGDSLAH